MARKVSLEVVWDRLAPYRDLCERCENAMVYETVSDAPFTDEERQQFGNMVTVLCTQEEDQSPRSIAEKLKPFWPRRSLMSLIVHINDFRNSHQEEIARAATMYKQLDIISNINDILHQNNLLSMDEEVVSLLQ